MAKMVKPVEVRVTVAEAGSRDSGVCVQAIITVEDHSRMKLELLRRQRQGRPATIDALLREMIGRAKGEWPDFPEEEEKG